MTRFLDKNPGRHSVKAFSGRIRIGSAYLFGSTSLGYGKTDTKNCVGTKTGLVGCAIHFNQEIINSLLVLDVKALCDESRGDDLVNILHSLEDAYRWSVTRPRKSQCKLELVTRLNLKCEQSMKPIVLFQRTLASPMRLVSVSEFACLVHT
jgi:hypothetical protein